MNLDLFIDHDDLSEQEQALIADVINRARVIADNDPELCGTSTVNVIITSADFIRSLNRDYRQKDSVTDVLSFPLEEAGMLGEVYICWQRTTEQAAEYGYSLKRELSWLVIHGLLHLIGYKHGNEPNRQMRVREEELLTKMDAGR
ncbi:MAG: rRNA maturation RNase YbeY [Firmicutes bacterium]|nr:rRNA maturation RNase YbeY [Bacillota bacterium]